MAVVRNSAGAHVLVSEPHCACQACHADLTVRRVLRPAHACQASVCSRGGALWKLRQRHSSIACQTLPLPFVHLQVDLPEGQLVISPLREQWLQRTGDLLADTFVDAKGIQPYR